MNGIDWAYMILAVAGVIIFLAYMENYKRHKNNKD